MQGRGSRFEQDSASFRDGQRTLTPCVMRFSLVLLVASLAGRGLPHASRDDRPRHDLHLTYSKITVDGMTVRCRVRVFKDDIEKGLGSFARKPALQLGQAQAVNDSIFGSYFNAGVAIAAGGKRLTFKVMQSGPDPDATDPAMWWFEVVGAAPTQIRELTVRIGLLVEIFPDQRNVVTLIRMPGEDRHSFFFSRSDTTEQRLSWKK